MAWEAKELCVLPESRFLQPSESTLTGEDKKCVERTLCDIFNLQTKSLRFPGGQPCSIRRHEIPNLKEDYYVSLKSDGVRFMLLLTKIRGKEIAVMVDRLMNVYEIEIWGNPPFFNGSLFDGELVWDYGNTPPTLTYLIFDVICAKGKSFVDATYENRILEANRCVISNIPHFLNEEDLDAYIEDEDKIYSCNNLHNLKLCIKKVLPVEQLATVWEARHAVNHMNDGVVFTKNGKVTAKYDVYKWKPENTIDILFSLLVPPTSGSVDMFIRNGKNLVPCTHIEIESKRYEVKISENRMIQYIAQSECTKTLGKVEFVAECICNVDQSSGIITIFPVKCRGDKTSPNNITTIIETIHNIIENVQISEFHDVLSDSFQKKAEPSSPNVTQNDSSTRSTRSGQKRKM